jgi:hypothetical protein
MVYRSPRKFKRGNYQPGIDVLSRLIDSRSIDDDMWTEIAGWIVQNRGSLNANAYIRRKHKVSIFALSRGRATYIVMRALRKIIPSRPCHTAYFVPSGRGADH